MKTILRMGLICLVAVLSLSVSSCGSNSSGGSKIDQEELNKKIEAMDVTDNGDMKLDFTDAEYEFMAKYLQNLDKKGENISEDDFAQGFVYGIILAEAESEGLLKGEAKKLYDEIDK